MGGGSSSSYSSYDYSSKAIKKSAKSYAEDDEREYKRPSRGLKPPVGMNIKSKSKHSLVFLLDVTGSMSDWPEMILEKLPTLYVETNNAIQGITPQYAEKNKNKLKEVLDFAILAIGDEREGDKYPIQVTEFTKQGGLQEKIKTIYPEGGGGGNTKESYDLSAYFAVNHCYMKDKNPICIIACDEGFFEYIEPSEVKYYTGDVIDERIKTKQVMNQLKNKFQTYVLRKNYGSSSEERINSQWKSVFGDRVIKMSSPGRLVDAAIVAAAHSQGHLNVGLEWIRRRQTDSQIKEVENSFKHLMTKPSKKGKKKDLNKLLEERHPFKRKK